MGIAERRKREKEMREKVIQDAAAELFMQKGFFLVKMEDIAEKAELSIATIYLYFKSKDELYASLIIRILQSLLEQMRRVYTDDSLTEEQKILGFKDALYTTYQANPTMVRIIFHVQLYDVLTSLNKRLVDKLNRLGRNVLAMIADTYEQGVHHGRLHAGHGMLHADILWATFSGLLLWEETKSRMSPGKNFLSPTLDRAFDIFCRGVRAESLQKRSGE